MVEKENPLPFRGVCGDMMMDEEDAKVGEEGMSEKEADEDG